MGNPKIKSEFEHMEQLSAPQKLKRQPHAEPLTDDAGEVRELTWKDAAGAVPFSALPDTERAMLLSLPKRGPQKSPKKVAISIRLSADVAQGLRATGEGWQVRTDEALRSWLATQAKS